MKPSLVRSTRLSGSVKLRCTLGSGSFEGRRGTGPERFAAATACAVELVLLRVGCFRSFKPAIHFGAKLRLTRLHAFVAHRLVFGGVRLDLRAVEGDMPELR